MERIVTIDEAYRKQMAEDAEVHREDISTDLINFSKVLARYVQDSDCLLRQFKKAQRDYDEVFKTRYEYYRFKGEFVASEKDAEKQCKGDPEVITAREKMENVELDFNLINDYKDLFKQRYWALKTFVDYEKFKHGE